MGQLTDYGHTNCCGVNIVVPCERGPRSLQLVEQEAIKKAFRKRMTTTMSATALVRFVAVPDYFIEEFEGLIAKKAHFTLAARRKWGNLYICCNPPEGLV